jgi:PGF-pre-PGF domain-containing protein
MCFGPWQNNCWQYDSVNGGNESECTSNGCTWENKTGWCYEPVKDFSDINTEGECLKMGWGFWNGTDCIAPAGGINFDGINPGCWIFDGLPAECATTKGCSYDTGTGTCNGINTIECGNITNQTICEGMTMLSTCCKWQAGQCSVSYESKCWDAMAEPPEGAMHCMDYNAIDSPTLCNQIAGSPWYMPCKWDNSTGQCTFKDSMAKDVENIKTRKSCEFLGGTWKTETVCDDSGTPDDTSDDKPKLNSWCELPTGASNYGCDVSCWACNSSTLCTNSKKGYCVWNVDSNHPQGGFCDIPEELEINGDCDKFCGSCEYYIGGDYTPQKACKESKAQCKWDNATSRCINKKGKGCAEDCFSCFEKETCTLKGGGSQGICKWDDVDEMCQPASFTGEICFNGMDDNNNGEIDCDDPGCMFDPFCGGGDMGTCWLYLDQTSCETNGCIWFQDPWTQKYKCGMKGEKCFTYGNNQSGCDGDVNCQWFSEEHCEINNTKADKCFTYTTQTNCEARTYCKWSADPFSPQGGWCDFAPFECQWNSTLQQSKTKCESNSLCVWNVDPWSQQGRCEPQCFAMDSTTMEPKHDTQTKCEGALAGGLCQWISGWCEPNSTTTGTVKGGDCASYDNDRTECENQPGCAWFEQMMGGPIGVGSGPGFGGSLCDVKHDFDCNDFKNATTCNSSNRNGTFESSGDGNACRWVTDGSWSWCAPVGEHCGPMHSPFCVGNTCYSTPQTNATSCAADPYCMPINDTYQNNNEICVPKCMNSSISDMATCQAVADGRICIWIGSGAGSGQCDWEYCQSDCSGCPGAPCAADCGDRCAGCGNDSGTGLGGWCDPIGMKQVFEAMEGGRPHEIASDTCPESSLNAWTDACFIGIKEMPDDYGIGIGLKSMTYAAVCNGETLWDGSTGSGRKTIKGYLYLDTDGNDTNNCYSDDKNYTGFEFKLSASWRWSNEGLVQSLSAERCLNANWSAANIALNTHPKKMCQELQGIIVTVNKIDLKKLSSLFNPKYAMRIYGVTGNETATAALPSDKIGPGYYKPGGVDFKVEDCNAIGNVDTDGDGFFAYEDPDCKHIYMKHEGGFKSFEDCITAWDDDMDGLVNCDDSECKDEIVCGGKLDFDENDHTPPNIKNIEASTGMYSSGITYNTDERANGTLTFYFNDSTCSTVNATIRDPGLWKENNTNLTKYKFVHTAKINNLTHPDRLNYSLNNGTTYYYKTKVCDISGNCQVSGCLNFTTRATAKKSTLKFSDPDTGEKWQINKGSGNYTQQGSACAGISNSSLGETVNPDEVDEISIRTERNSSSGSNISVDIGGIDTDSDVVAGLDLDIGSATGSKSGTAEDYVWMNESSWSGNEGVFTQGAPDNVTLVFPGNDTELWDCEDIASNGSLANCTNITSYATRYYDNTTNTTKWVIPDPTADLWSYIVDQTPTIATGGGDDDGTTSSSSSSGGGGGGGGGQAVPSNIKASKARYWSSILAGTSSTMEITDVDIAVNELTFSVAVTSSACNLVVRSFTDKPSAVADAPSGIVYQYFEIAPENIEGVTSAKISFKVSKNWLSDNSILENDVTLNRYENGQWTSLFTTLVRSDLTYNYYEATSSGFSYFAITGKPTVTEAPVEEEVEEPQEEVAAEQPPAVEEEIKGEVAEEEVKPKSKAYIIWTVSIILVLLVITAVLIYEKARGKGGLPANYHGTRAPVYIKK